MFGFGLPERVIIGVILLVILGTGNTPEEFANVGGKL